MGYSLMRDRNEDNVDFVASNGGLAELDQFVETNRKEYPALSRFLDAGETTELKEVLGDAKLALKQASKDNAIILKLMIKSIQRAKKEVWIVS